MGYVTGRQALQREIELLEVLQKATHDFKVSVANDSKATFIANDWLGSFVKLGKINESLIADSDVDFEAALIGERKLLSSFLDVAKDSGFVESWQDLFQNDIKIVELLLKQ